MTRDQIEEALDIGHLVSAQGRARRVDVVQYMIAEAVAAERERVITITADFTRLGPVRLAELRKRCAK